MPLTQITEEQSQSGRAQLQSDFEYLLDDKGVSSEIKGLLGHFGIKRIPTMAALEPSEEALRVTLQKEFGLDGSEGMAVKVQISNLIEVWTAARARSEAKDKEDAAARAEGRARVLPVPTHVAMRRAHEKIHGKVTDAEFPCRFWIQTRAEQVEDHDFKAESLTDVVSVKEAGEENPETGLLFNPTTGAVRSTQPRVKVQPPKDPEELRYRYRLMKAHWEIIRAKFNDRRAFERYQPEVWDTLVNFLLGPEIYGYRAHGGTRLRWDDLLAFEFEIRRAAMVKVTDGVQPLTEALTSSWKDPDLKGTHFTLQLVTSGKRGNSGDHDDDDNKKLRTELNAVKNELAKFRKGAMKGSGGKGDNKGNWNWGEGSGSSSSQSGNSKGGGKGNNTNKGGGGDGSAKLRQLKNIEKLRTKTDGPEGKQICFFFQVGNCRNGSNCKFPHVCLRCHKPGHTILDGTCKATPNYK